MRQKKRHSLLRWLSAFGIEPARTLAAIRRLPITFREYSAIKRQNRSLERPWAIKLSSPHFTDREEPSGTASGHYFHQDLLVAKRIYERNPIKHVDVGSRIDGFVAHISVFREIEVLDIRPNPAVLPNIKFIRRDVSELGPDLENYCDSISCLHALEHFGLGRYGDTVDAEGFVRGFAGLTRLLKRDGILYLSVPIGNERIEFNGQRVFSIQRVIDLFEKDFEMIRFSYIDDSGDLHEDRVLGPDDVEHDLGMNYGCGIFELKKL